ncbi:MAG: type I secretion system permease/ATPase [Pseudomonadaceae bacterium]|nr:type I secretion system permease/ATPase [Pseudomonadaceae bacterium]
MNQPSSATSVAPLQADSQDSLQGCLLFFLKRYRINTTLTSLLNGLPLVKSRLTPQLFTRAATQAGLASRVVKRKAEDISPHVLPAVAMMASGRSVILLERTVGEDGDTRTGAFAVLDTYTGEEQRFETLEEFDKVYGGFLILVRQGMVGEMTAEARDPKKQWFWATVRQFRPLYNKVLVSALVINTVALASPLFVMNVYDRVVPNHAYETLWVLALGVAIAYVFDAIFKQLRVYFLDVAGKGADILLGSKIYQQLLNLRLGEGRISAGAFANQLRDYDSLRDFFTSSTLVTLVDVPFLFMFIGVIALLGGSIALVPLVAVPLILVISAVVQGPMMGLTREVSKELDMKHGHLVETIYALENIKSMGSQSHAQGRWEQLSGISARLSNKTRFLSNLALNSGGFVQQMVYVALIVWGVYKVTEGEMTMGALIACSMLLSRALAPLSSIAGLFVRYAQAKNSMETLTKFMNSPVERPLGKSFVHVGQLRGEMVFDKVSFAYPGSKLASLNDVSFSIKPGERVGIVGRAGSGKSTLSRLMLNLYNPSEGSIMYDGLEIRQLDPAELRANICYFPQNLYLFRGTLRENLLLANPDAPDSALMSAVEVSGAYRLIRRHPMGFDLPVGERGELLSGGQRQAVGLARALMQQGNLVILDDPTSEMDSGSEAWVKERLGKWLKNRTLVLITHRPGMLDLVDRLLVIDDGKLVADGPKAEVLAMLQQNAAKAVQGGKK